jgi:tetratricopeptide (TPR) repeat protein
MIGMSIGPQESLQRLLSEVSGAVGAGDFARAFEAASLALRQGLRHPTFFNARGLWFQRSGDFQAALAEFQAALALAPNMPIIQSAIGVCLQQLGLLNEAREAFDAALKGMPNFAQTHYRKGKVLADLGEHDEAERCYERAIALDPNSAEAIASLASVLARQGKPERARELAARALSLNADEPTAKIALAVLDIAEKDYSQAEQRLRSVLDHKALMPLQRAAVLSLIGDTLDGQKRYSDAFAVYAEKNDLIHRQFESRYGGEPALDAIVNLKRYFDAADPENWRAPDDGGDTPGSARTHVFLAGFLRSGTTLLEQVLASNPDIDALEEKALLHEEGERYLTSVEGLDALAKLTPAEADAMRRAYWNRVKDHGLNVEGRIFVDKQPLNTTKLPLIAKLFPKAKLIFALRDPRDVVFSCYRRHFGVNGMTYAFLKLDTAARFYAGVMDLTELFRAKLACEVYEHRYEDMVVDFEPRVRAVCDFLGIAWDDKMREFNKYVPALDLRSPSVMQVRKPLYSDALAQWRRYGEDLQPIVPILAPWAEKFGYPPA